jgi:hypothetical protein
MVLYAYVLCLRIITSLRIPRYDLGRRIPHASGGSVTSNFDSMTSTYNITNYVLDEIDQMTSFNFLLEVLQYLTQI